MKVKTMRILTLLLAMVLMFGLFPGVAQASAYEDHGQKQRKDTHSFDFH